jgi:hypothetical protein
VEEVFMIDADNSIIQTQDAAGWSVVVMQDGVSGGVNLSINGDGALELSGVNFVIDPALIPSSGAGLGTANVFTAVQTIAPPLAATTGTQTLLLLDQPCTATPLNGFGGNVFFRADTDNNTMREQAKIEAYWKEVADATRKASLDFSVFDTGQRLALRISTNGAAPMLGFFGVPPVAQPTGSASVIGFTQNAGTPVLDGSTFTGPTGGQAYTIDGIVRRLKSLGILA